MYFNLWAATSFFFVDFQTLEEDDNPTDPTATHHQYHPNSENMCVCSQGWARPILVVDNKSNFVGSLPSARGSTKLFMSNYGAVIAEVGPGSQTVCVVGPCNKLKGLLIVFFLCDIWYSLSLDVSQINAKWTIFENCVGQHNVFLLGKNCDSWGGPPSSAHRGYNTVCSIWKQLCFWHYIFPGRNVNLGVIPGHTAANCYNVVVWLAPPNNDIDKTGRSPTYTVRLGS